MQHIVRKVGSWLFLVGVLIAVIVGAVMGYYVAEGEVFLPPDAMANNPEWTTTVGGLLAVLGFVVGILSFFALGQITKERIPTFLLGALILVMIGALSQTWTFGTNESMVYFFQALTGHLAYFAAPAAGLLAIRAIWDAGKTEEIEKVIPKIPE